MSYYIGVDGGGTKSLVALFDENKNMLDSIKTIGSNHENLKGSFEEASQILMDAINSLIARNKLSLQDIEETLMGLAGIDHQFQHDALYKLLYDKGLRNMRIYNDGFIITKAGLGKGEGIGYNCGTGTCCNSIDSDGKMLQVGGFDRLSADMGNGHWIAIQTFRAIYDDLVLAVKETSMTRLLFEKLDREQSSEALLATIGDLEAEDEAEDYIRLLIDVFFEALNAEDEAAFEIARKMAVRGSEFICAHLKKSNFKSNTVNVVLSGSIHAKLPSEKYIEMLKAECKKRSGGKELCFITLKVAPVMGCINWILENK